MAGNAFTAGVKPGGLNSSTEIRILLCYLIKIAASPLTGEELEAALLNEALVNYFEFAACLSDLCGFSVVYADILQKALKRILLVITNRMVL